MSLLYNKDQERIIQEVLQKKDITSLIMIIIPTNNNLIRVNQKRF